MKCFLPATFLLLLCQFATAQYKEASAGEKLSSGITYVPLVSHISESEPHATIYFYRAYLNPFVAPIRSMPFTINDSLIYDLKANRMISFIIAPGKYMISADKKDKTSMGVTLKAGQEYFFEGEMPIGYYTSLSLTQIKPDIARKKTGLPGAVNDTKTIVSNAPTDTLQFRGDSIPAHFPGGNEAWNIYLEHNLNASLGARYIHVKRGQTVDQIPTVSFIVDTLGKIKDVEVINLAEVHEKLAAEAVRVIKTGPDWIPATINGRKVAYRQKQNIVFRVSAE